MNTLIKSFDKFTNLSKDPSTFLSCKTEKAQAYLEICATIYASIKSFNKLSKQDPFTKLLVDGFDDEQIWQQIELFNAENIKTCSRGTSLCLNNWVELCPDLKLTKNVIETVISDDDVYEDDAIDEDLVEEDNEEYDSDEKNSFKQNNVDTKEKEVFEKSEVDDDFFSLRQMEKFLEAEESGNIPINSDDDVDYFNDIPSTDDENGLFDDDDNDASEDGFKFDENDFSAEFNDSGAEEMNAEIQSDDGSHDDDDDDDDESNKIKHSVRNLKYNEFFPDENPKEVVSNTDEKEVETLSNFQKEQLKISRKIQALEEEALGEKSWQMKGEASASKRPVNSLIEEVLTFQHSERPAPDITDEHTHDLEAIIRQRVKDKSWDDVERKIKELKDPFEYKKKVVLDSEQSKLSLQEIYEKEYLSKVSQEAQEDKENPAHVELKSLMTDLFHNLDALANFHFKTAPPEPEIKVMTNLPSISMEEVQPITHSEADLLAPEEIHLKEEMKGDLEKTSTDKKRERRKKAARQKARAKSRLQKLNKLADTNEKLQAVRAVKQLEDASKRTSGQTTIIRGTNSRKRQQSSKSFFDKLNKDSTKKQKTT